MKSVFRGIFLTSARPAETARFYRDVAGLSLETIGEGSAYVYWRFDRDGVQIAIHDAAAFADHAYPPLAHSNLTHLYFKIDDQNAFLDHIKTQGLEPHAVDDVVVTIVDPDGRKVLFGIA